MLINKSDNELILRRRKILRIKKYITVIIILCAIAITLCLKLPYFNIKNIKILNNRNITYNEIKKLSLIDLGQNIFYLNLNKSKANILSNPYIMSVKIKRNMPNEIVINIEEKNAVFYVKDNDKYLIVDKDGTLLEEKSSITGMKLLNLYGFKSKDYKIGEILDKSDSKKIKIINEITMLINNLKDGVVEPNAVNIEDTTDIKLYYGNMLVKLGTSEDLKEKFNTAINILLSNNLINKKGYIDVSFKASPVFFVND